MLPVLFLGLTLRRLLETGGGGGKKRKIKKGKNRKEKTKRLYFNDLSVSNL